VGSYIFIRAADTVITQGKALYPEIWKALYLVTALVWDQKSRRPYIQNLFPYGKQCLDFSFVFSAHLPARETCFQLRGSSAVEGTS